MDSCVVRARILLPFFCLGLWLSVCMTSCYVLSRLFNENNMTGIFIVNAFATTFTRSKMFGYFCTTNLTYFNILYKFNILLSRTIIGVYVTE